jgi:steroid 5-alpha reductase family enzyme
MDFKPFLKSYNDAFIITDCIKSIDTSDYSSILIDLNKCYINNNSLSISFYMFVLFAIYSFVWSIIGNNCSKVDQIWSITPIVYAIHFFYHNCVTSNTGILHERGLVVIVLISLWGLRLTYNFYRRNGYGNLISHEEDYRWPILRKKMNVFTFLIFNLTFIATYQNLLLWLITLPVYVVISGTYIFIIL